MRKEKLTITKIAIPGKGTKAYALANDNQFWWIDEKRFVPEDHVTRSEGGLQAWLDEGLIFATHKEAVDALAQHCSVLVSDDGFQYFVWRDDD